MNEPAAVQDLIAKARLGFETAARFLPGIESAAERQRLTDKLERLGRDLSGAESLAP